MGLFQSLFGSSSSGTATADRNAALQAFNAIQTPALSALQVQLQKEVVAGTLTPEQAESSLLSSNAFNQIATDPSLVGAQKQAIQQLQQIGTQGGLTAVDKAQLNDINNQQNQQNQSQNAATMQQAQQRGMGNSGMSQVNQLINEQGSADRAANSGMNVAAQAQTRALQALQGAGSQAGALQGQEYSQAANKAQAQNAIDLFNKQTLNNTNLYNVQAANQAQAVNLANTQNVSNTNTGIANTQAQTNAAAAQKQYEDAMQKASGIAGVDTSAANAAQQTASQDFGANVGLTGGLISAGGKAAMGMMGGPAAIAATNDMSGSTSAPGTMANSGGTGVAGSVDPYGNPLQNFAEGGDVPPTPTPKKEDDKNWAQKFIDALSSHVGVLGQPGADANNVEDPASGHAEGGRVAGCGYCAGGSCMAHGGIVPQAPHSILPNGKKGWTLHDPQGQPVGDFRHYEDATDYAKNMQPKQPSLQSFLKPPTAPSMPVAPGMANGGPIGPIKKGALHEQMGVPQGQPMPAGRLEKATHSDNELLRKRAQFAENAKHWNHAEGGEVEDFRAGGPVPGVPKVPHNSFKNDTVPAKLSPGEVVIPLNAQKSDDTFESFMNKFKPSNKPARMAEGGDVSSPTRTATETGGSSPGGASTGGVGSGIGGAGTGGAATGGASTGGAGTVTVTISGDSGKKGSKGGDKKAPTTINISNVGGKTDSGSTTSGDGPGSSGTGGSGKGSGGGGGGAAPSEPGDPSAGMAEGGNVPGNDEFESFMNQFKPTKKAPAPRIDPSAPLDKLALNNLHKRMGK